MKAVSVVIAILAFLILRPYALQNSTILYSGDDQNYFAHATSLAYGQFPSYDKEYFVWGGKSPAHSIGAAILAEPFVFAGSLIDRLLNRPIIKQRTLETISGSWSLFGFVLASGFYLWLGCFLLWKSLILFFKPKTVSFFIILIMLFEGLSLYAFRRPVFSHLYEWFLQATLFSFLFSFYYRKTTQLSISRLITIGVLCSLTFLVRYNNAVFAILWPIIFLPYYEGNSFIDRKWKSLFVIYGVAFLMAVIFLVYPWIFNGGLEAHTSLLYGNASSGMWNYIFSFNSSIKDFLKTIVHVFVGLDWGLLWTAPYLVLGIVILLFSKYPLKKEHLILSAGALVNFCLACKWIANWQQGSWYGYRLFIFSALPLVIYPWLFYFQTKKPKKQRALQFFFLVSLFPLFSMLLFDGNATTLTLDQNSVNSFYQLEVWKTFLTHPLELVIALVKGGVLYVTYLLAFLFHKTQLLPAIVLEKYPSFAGDVLVKSTLIYLLPFILYKSLVKSGKKQHSY